MSGHVTRVHWEFGDQRTLTIAASDDLLMVGVEEESAEGYLLMHEGQDITPTIGQRYVAEFVPGGPYDGYWKLLREAR